MQAPHLPIPVQLALPLCTPEAMEQRTHKGSDQTLHGDGSKGGVSAQSSEQQRCQELKSSKHHKEPRQEA